MEQNKATVDVAKDFPPRQNGILDKVGMEEVEIPILLEIEGRVQQVPAKHNIFVNLDDPNIKGIHMSRLYLHAQEHLEKETLSAQSLVKLSQDLMLSHADISNSSYIETEFNLALRRRALLSNKKGWRFYPVKIKLTNQDEKLSLELELQITYSSTCPCSAALARELTQQKFLKHFNGLNPSKERVAKWLLSEEGQGGTAHGQRSIANLYLDFGSNFEDLNLINTIITLIDGSEATLATAVQAAVKREDEQEFAKLNAENLMFAEDAARILKSYLTNLTAIQDFQVKVSHQESLHPHNAVAYANKL